VASLETSEYTLVYILEIVKIFQEVKSPEHIKISHIYRISYNNDETMYEFSCNYTPHRWQHH